MKEGVVNKTLDQPATAEEAAVQALLAAGMINAAGIERAKRLCEASGARLHAALTKLGLVSERDLAATLAKAMSLRLALPEDYPDEPLAEHAVSQKFLKESKVLPLHEDGGSLALAMADPLDGYAIRAIELLTGKKVEPWVAVPAEIDAAMERLFGGAKSAAGGLIEDFGADSDDSATEDVERLRDLASEAPVIRLVNSIIAKAVESRASDIHIEPFANGMKLRYRIDGVLRELDPPPARFRAAVISRVKIMAKLNIAERRLPQDGRIKLVVRGKDIDLRVSTVPTLYGESVVLRVLDRGSIVLNFARLGLRDPALEAFLAALDRPNGIVLVTGPTGSGKTTTLYTSLVRLNTPERKILTVEDPIEYQLDGVNQIQVKPQIGLSFANILRSILRQDPDTIMIGEIRDLETAQIAVQAALTGHLVLSTLHTNNAASTVTRLLDMGVEDYLLTSTVNGVLAQRLVRTLCGDCREAYPALPELVEELQLARLAGSNDVTLHRAKGCARCNSTGYFGRTTIAEMLPISDDIRRLVLKRVEAGELQRAAVGEGMRTMYDDGLIKALAGETTVEEVLRVIRDA